MGQRGLATTVIVGIVVAVVVIAAGVAAVTLTREPSPSPTTTTTTSPTTTTTTSTTTTTTSTTTTTTTSTTTTTGTTTSPMWTSSTYIDPADTSPGDVWFSPDTGTLAGTSYSDEVHVNSGTSKLGAYKFIINYNENVINVDTSKGDYQGADTGADGFVSAFNAVVPGKIVVNGFSAMGTGPGEDLHVLTIYWTTVGTGTTTLDLTVEQLADEVRDNIGTPNGLDGARTVE